MSDPLSIKVMNVLTEAALNHSFPGISYSGGVASAGQGVYPTFAKAHEASADFSINKRHGLGLKMKRDGWSFQMILKFCREVSLDSFEQILADNPPKIPRTEEHDQVVLYLSKSRFLHPVEHENSNGTEALIAFNAIIGTL